MTVQIEMHSVDSVLTRNLHTSNYKTYTGINNSYPFCIVIMYVYLSESFIVRLKFETMTLN